MYIIIIVLLPCSIHKFIHFLHIKLLAFYTMLFTLNANFSKKCTHCGKTMQYSFRVCITKHIMKV